MQTTQIKNATKGLGGRGNLNGMKKSCLASMFHVAGSHDSCLKSNDSWCQYQLDKINNTNFCKSKGELTVDIRKAILPIYTDLCKEEMMKKLLHGKTQNNNESFNGTIWNRVAKSTHVGLSTLCFGVYDAISHFNYGQKAALDTMEFLT